MKRRIAAIAVACIASGSAAFVAAPAVSAASAPATHPVAITTASSTTMICINLMFMVPCLPLL